ncbi:MAG: phosphoribosylformylglycinamidine synthase subunit PurL [Tepidisphaeraceae bacterium]
MIWRVEVHPAGREYAAESVRLELADPGFDVPAPQTFRIFLIDSEASPQQMQRVGSELLADPVTEQAVVQVHAPEHPDGSLIEIHPRPGVMDPVAASTELAIRDMRVPVREVRTGRAFQFPGRLPHDVLADIARRALANEVIESVHFAPFFPREFERGRERQFELRTIPLACLSDDSLAKLSRDAHLFLSTIELRAIQTHFAGLGRDPTDIELETLAQTWSEHCVHKTLKSAVEVYDESGRLLRRYDSLLRDTIFSATGEITRRPSSRAPFCLSVFVDNAGIIAFDDHDAVCFKVETHNHPSAIEPYGGASTGVGGVIRDILGTGLGARPIASTDVFCVAPPAESQNSKSEVRNAMDPTRVLRQVVAGVRDYGNRMGIPTVNGAVFFDGRYIGNPLVFCGCVGIMPRDKIAKGAHAGDAIVLMGGRTGRDGIHGATFSSSELSDTHAEEFSHAVQIGNAITQKKLADVVLAARDRGLFTGITDCGAGGLSSAVGEMGETLGATVDLEKVPLKYEGLRYDEIWISEAQERMVLSVPPEHVAELLDLARSEDVEATAIGEFGTEYRELVLKHAGHDVGRLSVDFLHRGLPMPARKAVIRAAITGRAKHRRANVTKQRVLELLAHPNTASKHWIIRQYDHEVQGGTVIKPLVGPRGIGPSDASVIRPKPDSYGGVVIACGLAPLISDAYEMAIASIDEAIRNAVCVGADPDRIALLDNFCWPGVEDERTMGDLVRACEACRDAALALGTPFISGKDSLNNQFVDSRSGKVIRIPNTLLISAIGVIQDVRSCVTMDLKGRTNRVCLIGARDPKDLNSLAATHRLVARLIREGQVLACHDLSDGGLWAAAAEMCIASGMGLIVAGELFMDDDAFAERPGRYLIELVDSTIVPALRDRASEFAHVREAGLVQHLRKITVTSQSQRVLEIGLQELTDAWRGPVRVA